MFEKLPTIAGLMQAARNECDAATPVFFFNEHYVVKPPKSHVEFRWHPDDDEQLAETPGGRAGRQAPLGPALRAQLARGLERLAQENLGELGAQGREQGRARGLGRPATGQPVRADGGALGRPLPCPRLLSCPRALPRPGPLPPPPSPLMTRSAGRRAGAGAAVASERSPSPKPA